MIVNKETILQDKVKDLKMEIRELKKRILVQNATIVGFTIGFISSLAYLLFR